MHRTMLKSKLHRVTCTGSDVHRDGSCVIDQDLLDAADIRPFQRIEITNVNNGERFSTYALAAPRGSGTVAMNGALAHKASRGDVLNISAYASYGEAEVAQHEPDLVFVDANNAFKDKRGGLPVQKAA
jgi:aspartate 1-decarboxylase